MSEAERMLSEMKMTSKVTMGIVRAHDRTFRPSLSALSSVRMKYLDHHDMNDTMNSHIMNSHIISRPVFNSYAHTRVV